MLSDVEDYAIEMATIAQYNDETFQSISKVMGRGSGGIINLPQEMSIAQEPIKSSGRGSFDTNGIDSAFIGGQVEATSTGASGISASTSTSTASPVSSTISTRTTSSTLKSEPKSSSTMTMKQTTTPTPIATATETTTYTGSVIYSTASGTTTHETTVNKATTSATKTGTIGRTITTIGGQSTGTPNITSNGHNHHNHQHGNSAYTTTAYTNANAPIYATTTTLPRIRPTVQITTTEKIHTVAKILTAETGDVLRANGRRPTAATLADIAKVVAKIPYTVASTLATSTTSHPLNALHDFVDKDVATTKDAPTTEPPIHVYKKIDFPGLPINDNGGYMHKPTATPFFSTSATTFSSPITRKGNNGATKRYSTPLAMVASTAISASARPADALNSTYAAETATSNMVSDTLSPVASVTVDESDDDTNNWNIIPSSPSSLPAKTGNDGVTATMTSASVTAEFDVTSTATATATATITTTTKTTSTIIPPESPTTVAVTTTAAPANHRKIANYDAYTDHPNRSRHIVHPKQQHHHSYPYILYRLLG